MPVVIKKYKFFTRKTNFIGFIIKLGYISMDLKKVKANVLYKRVAYTSESRTPPTFCNASPINYNGLTNLCLTVLQPGPYVFCYFCS